MTDKTLFCDSIRALQAQYDHDSQWSNALAALFPNERFSGIYDNSKVNNALLHILQIQLDDAHAESWIEYFCYELSFGRKYKFGNVTVGGLNIDLSSPENLYDYLISLNKTK